jgi:hypothetical protein
MTSKVLWHVTMSLACFITGAILARPIATRKQIAGGDE